MKRKLAYGVVILITLLASILSTAQFPRFLLAFELLFAAAMAIWVRCMARRLQISLVLPEKTVLQGDLIRLKLQVKNPTVFPAGRIEAKLAVRDLSGWQANRDGAGKQIPICAGADGRSTDSWQLEISPVHCGLLSVEPVEVRLFDYIGLCSVRLKGPFTVRYVSVLPHIYGLQLSDELRQACSRESGQEDVAPQAGSDTQEIFDTRFYRRGDTLHKVHWKLSAKTDDLMVKEFSMPIDTAVRIAADCELVNQKKTTMEQMDHFLEMAAAFAAYCLEQSRPCEIVWYSPAEESLHYSRMENEAELYTALEELLGIQPYLTAIPAEEKTKYQEKVKVHPRLDTLLADETDLLRIALDGSVYSGGSQVEAVLLKDEK